MKKYNVGFIGLGNVGSKIAKNILKNKNNLFIHDLDKKKGFKLIKDGAVWSNNLEELSEKSDIIITCLPSPKAVNLLSSWRSHVSNDATKQKWWKNKFNKVKYFEAEIYENNNKYLLIKNNKFNFLKNLLIFPMKEIDQNKFKSSFNKSINIKISNMDMRITINKIKKNKYFNNSFLIGKDDLKNHILPSFTKKIFNSIMRY